MRRADIIARAAWFAVAVAALIAVAEIGATLLDWPGLAQ